MCGSGEGSEVCYCVAWKMRGIRVPGCVGVILFSTCLTLFNTLFYVTELV